MTGFQRIFSGLLLAFLSVLSISGTIALRNVLHVILLGMVLWVLLFARERLRFKPLELARKVPVTLYLWIAFLLLFPLWAAEPDVAWFNLRGQWGESILTWVLAYGAVLVLGASGPGLWVLAMVSATPVFLHLFLTLLAWSGLLTPTFYSDPSLFALWGSSKEVVLGGIELHQQPFPWEFRGVEPMHGNIGYAASQAIALACVCVCVAWSERNWKLLSKAVLLLMGCFFSVIVAASRGAVYFGLILVFMTMFLYWLHGNRTSVQGAHTKFLIVMAAVLIAATALVVQVARKDVRWYSMFDKIEVGLHQQEPVRILCEGLSSKDIEEISLHYADRAPNYVQGLIAGLQGQDGGRVLLMRAGLQLVQEHPYGLDGSRQAYQKRMLHQCGHTPALDFAHAHQAWINMALALGWMGTLLFCMLLLQFVFRGWKHLRDAVQWPWGMCLMLVALFWILRGMADAVFQEHYLQMQAFALLYITLMVQKSSYK